MACGIQPSEIWRMDPAEFRLWIDQAVRIHGAADT